MIPGLCEALGISLNTFFGQAVFTEELTSEDRRVLSNYHYLSQQNRQVIDQLMATMLDVQARNLRKYVQENFQRVWYDDLKTSAGTVSYTHLDVYKRQDYFRPEIGSISGAFFNTALVGTVCCALLFLPGAVTSGLTVTGYMLTVGFSFWGMNLVNILPFMFGTFVYSLIKREPFAKFVNFAMFSTALGPLASEMLYRYPGTEIHGVTLAGIGLALLIGVATGVAMPALCAHAKNFHKGYSLYSAGAAAGFWCFFLYATLYRTLGVEAPAIEAITSDGLSKTFVDVYCIVVFVLCIIAGFILSGNSFKGYWSLLKDTGYQVDFGTKYGNGPTVMNFGVYGPFIVPYYNLIGAKFTLSLIHICVEKIAKEVYGADGVDWAPLAVEKAKRFESDPKYNDYCTMMVKTHLSLSHDPALKGVPKGWRLPIRDILEYGGAKFLCPMAGTISMMPGTASDPAYRRVDVDTETGEVSGLF